MQMRVFYSLLFVLLALTTLSGQLQAQSAPMGSAGSFGSAPASCSDECFTEGEILVLRTYGPGDCPNHPPGGTEQQICERAADNCLYWSAPYDVESDQDPTFSATYECLDNGSSLRATGVCSPPELCCAPVSTNTQPCSPGGTAYFPLANCSGGSAGIVPVDCDTHCPPGGPPPTPTVPPTPTATSTPNVGGGLVNPPIIGQ